MSRIHFVGGEKGGVGKSVVARVLAQWFINRELPFAAIDADQSHGVLMRFYREYSQSVDLAVSESADQIIDRALGADRRVLVDLPGQSARALRTWLNEVDVIRFATEMGIAVTYWHVIDGGFASVSELDDALRYFGDKVRHVVVKNFGRGTDFNAFEQSESKRNLERFQGRVIEIPELQPAIMSAIDHSAYSFWGAVNHSDDDRPLLRPLDRQRVRIWLERCHAAMDANADVM